MASVQRQQQGPRINGIPYIWKKVRHIPMTNVGNLYRHISFGIAVFYSLGDSGCTGIGKWPRSPAIKQSLDSAFPKFIWQMTSLVAQMVKNIPAMQETRVPFLGWEDSPEEDMATNSSVLAWRITMDRQATVHGVAKSWTRLNN